MVAFGKSEWRLGQRYERRARILYLHIPNRELIYLLTLFTKGDADNLTAEGKKAMRQLAEQIKNEYRND